MARFHRAMVAAHRAAAAARRVINIADGTEGRQKVRPQRMLPQANGPETIYLKIPTFQQTIIPHREAQKVTVVTDFLRAYSAQAVPPDHPGYSWIALLMCIELHGLRIAAKNMMKTKRATSARERKYSSPSYVKS